MPKRKAKSEVTTVVSGDSRRSSKAEKKQKRSKSKSKKKLSKTETNQNAVVASFVRGLSHQIPPASLAHIANSSDSLRLLLEKSTESLPMGSAIRKAVGENFDLSVAKLTEEVALRLEEEEMSAEPSDDSKKEESQADQEEEEKFAAFSSAQYERSLQKMKSMDVASERKEYRKRLASTAFATADVLIPLPETDQDVELASAEAVLGAFRSASLTGRVNELTMGGYVTRMLTAVRAEAAGSPARSVSLMRNFMNCFAMSPCDKTSALMRGDAKTAYKYGEMVGLMVRVALTRPGDYVSSAGDGGVDEEDSSSSDDESDIEDDLPGGPERNSIQDVACNLTLQLMSVGPATPHVIGGIISVFLSQPDDGSDALSLHRLSNILAEVLINSSRAPKSVMPSKNVKSGKEKIRMIQRWAEGEIEKISRKAKEAVLSTEASIEEKRGGNEADLYNSSDEEENESDEDSSSEDGADEVDADEGQEQHGDDTRAAANESRLFVIDTAPDDDSTFGGEGEPRLHQDDEKEVASADPGKDEESGAAVESAKETKKSRGAASSKSSRPPRPPASAKKQSISTTTPRRSVRSRSRGDSVSSLASDNVASAKPNTVPRRSTRSRSRGESMGSMGSLQGDDGTPRRSARVRSRSRGESVSQT